MSVELPTGMGSSIELVEFATVAAVPDKAQAIAAGTVLLMNKSRVSCTWYWSGGPVWKVTKASHWVARKCVPAGAAAH